MADGAESSSPVKSEYCSLLPAKDEITHALRATDFVLPMAENCKIKEVTPLIEDYFKTIKDKDQTLHACVEVLEKEALERAKRLDEIADTDEGRKLCLRGLPMVVKINVDVTGSLSTASSPGLKDHKPKTTATFMQKLVDEGAIVLAKTAMPELAMRVDPHNHLHTPIARNPFDLERSTGGSSSGTGVAVASNMCVCGIGSDTCGSLRIPAACGGHVGFRPSLGRWPTDGMVPCISLMDTAGPMTKSVSDCILLDAVVAEADDDLKKEERLAVVADVKHEATKLRIYVADEWIERSGESLFTVETTGLEHAVKVLESAGASIIRKVENANFVEDVLELAGSRSENFPVDFRKDLNDYLEPHGIELEGVVENIAAAHLKPMYMLKEGAEREELIEKMGQVPAKLATLKKAYDDFMAKNKIDAILVPTLGQAPHKNELLI